MNEQPPAGCSDSSAVLESTFISYDWPADGHDPFTLDLGDQTLWILVAGSGWGKAWPAGDIRDYGTHRGFVDRVPCGRLAINLLERLAVAYNGQLLGRWPEVGITDPPTYVGYTGDAPYEVLQQQPHFLHVEEPSRFTNLDDALHRMLTIRTTPRMPIMTVRCLDSTSWW